MSEDAVPTAVTHVGAPPPEIDTMMVVDQLRASASPGDGVQFMEPARRGESLYAVPLPPQDE